jgi:membrane protein implicated in regulation of membrane protease activity
MNPSWWGQMTSVEHVYWIIAIAGSIFLLIQLVLAFVSGIDFHIGSDLGAHGGDFGFPHFQLLTLRNIVAFFAVFGWVGLAMFHAGASITLTIIVSFFCGLLVMVIMSAMFFGLSHLQSSGNIDVSLAKGQQANVYLTIPPTRKIGGKIEVTLQGKIIEMNAITDNTEPIPTGTIVMITDILNNQALVERK